MSSQVICSVEGCEKPFYGRNSCKSHYMNEYRAMVAKSPKPLSNPESIWLGIVSELGIEGACKRKVAF